MHLCSRGLGRSGEALVLLILLSGGMPGGGIQPLPVSCFPETLCHIQELRTTPLLLCLVSSCQAPATLVVRESGICNLTATSGLEPGVCPSGVGAGRDWTDPPQLAHISVGKPSYERPCLVPGEGLQPQPLLVCVLF